MKSSQALGKNVSAEITHISSNGIWLLAGDKESFMPYEDFPWFKDAPVRKILNVEEPHPQHWVSLGYKSLIISDLDSIFLTRQ